MKKVLLAFCMLLVGVITSQATSLFPFFGDLVGNYDTLKDSDNQFVAKGVSMLGDIEATESFMAAAGSPTATTCPSRCKPLYKNHLQICSTKAKLLADSPQGNTNTLLPVMSYNLARRSSVTTKSSA